MMNMMGMTPQMQQSMYMMSQFMNMMGGGFGAAHGHRHRNVDLDLRGPLAITDGSLSGGVMLMRPMIPMGLRPV